MRVFEDRATNYQFIDGGDSLHELMIPWGANARGHRTRMQVRYVVVKWKREGRGEWLLWHVWAHGPRIHKQTEMEIGATFIDCGAVRIDMPDWLSVLVEMSNPARLVAA